MYRVIGRRDGLTPEADTIAAGMIGAEVGNSLIGLFVHTIPDGVVFEYSEGGEVRGYYETIRLELVAVTKPGTVLLTKPRVNPVAVTREGLAAEMARAIKTYSRWYAVYRMGNRAGI